MCLGFSLMSLSNYPENTTAPSAINTYGGDTISSIDAIITYNHKICKWQKCVSWHCCSSFLLIPWKVSCHGKLGRIGVNAKGLFIMSDWRLEQMAALSRNSVVPSFTCRSLRSTIAQETIVKYVTCFYYCKMVNHKSWPLSVNSVVCKGDTGKDAF